MYTYVIHKSSGNIVVRSSGSLQLLDPETTFLVKDDRAFEPSLHVYDVKSGRFENRPPDLIAEDRIRLQQADRRRVEKARDLAKHAEELGILDFLLDIVEMPQDVLLEALRGQKEKRSV